MASCGSCWSWEYWLRFSDDNAYLEGQASATEVPVQVNAELTQACNLKCLHCYLDGRSSPAELSTARWLELVETVASMGTLFIGFTGGEILTRGDMFEICGRARDRGIFFHLQTNGTLIDAAVADEIKRLNPSKVDVSLYGSQAGLHDRVTRVPGSFERCIEGVRLLRERRIRVVFKTTVMKLNWQDVKKMEELAHSLGAGYACDPVVMPGISGSARQKQLRMEDDEFRSFMIERGWHRGSDSPPVLDEDFEEVDLYRHVICSAGRSRCAISSRGEVLPCVLWRLPAGDIGNEELEEIWHSTLFEDLRKLKLKDLKDCSNCTNINYCVRCAAMSYMETGDYTARASESCRMSSLLKGVENDEG